MENEETNRSPPHVDTSPMAIRRLRFLTKENEENEGANQQGI
jgi:hypothetical protein